MEININELQPGCPIKRTTLSEDVSLAIDIETNGLRNPIICTPEGYILDGYRRVLIYRMLGKKRIPVTIRG
jgi:ParB-like chromosome segregation protein Spo0J